MRDKVLKLCRRLKSCTLDDLVSFLDTDSAIIETVLLYLEQEELININNGIITINLEPQKKSNIEQKNLSLMREFISDDKFEIIVKSFCLIIPPQKTNILINTGKNGVCNYYAIFRDMIYKRQLKKLLNLFFKSAGTENSMINTHIFILTAIKYLSAINFFGEILKIIIPKKKYENLRLCIITLHEQRAII